MSLSIRIEENTLYFEGKDFKFCMDFAPSPLERILIKIINRYRVELFTNTIIRGGAEFPFNSLMETVSVENLLYLVKKRMTFKA